METNDASKRRNILLIISDQERQRGWIPQGLTLPNRQRIIDGGLEFTRYYTHSSPCSPSRASLFTGRYLPQHGVNDNVIAASHKELDPIIPTLGHMLRRAGYSTSYVGKWHLSHANKPDMEAYGFSDWAGNDRHFMGLAATGLYFDPIIARQGADWLRTHAASGRDPWFLVVCLVNPHDVMWFPADQASYQAAHPDRRQAYMMIMESAVAEWKEEFGEEAPLAFPHEYDEVFDTLPPNHDDDLFTKPAVQRQWLWEEHKSGFYGKIERDDRRGWLRKLDYYWRLHQEGDRNLGTVLDALEASGRWDDTTIIFTSDHGDMTGAHGLRSKGPWMYEEIMHVPLYVRAPGITAPGTKTAALGTHVDLAKTIVSLAGVDAAEDLPGRDLGPVLAEPSTRVRDSVLFAQDQGWYESCLRLRYASRAIFDGRYKYVRYYGVGGGISSAGTVVPGPKEIDADADFDDQEHEWYDHQEDPHELVNLANDRGRRKELREWFARLKEEEAREFGP